MSVSDDILSRITGQYGRPFAAPATEHNRARGDVQELIDASAAFEHVAAKLILRGTDKEHPVVQELISEAFICASAALRLAL